jgi:hypothetical protein
MRIYNTTTGADDSGRPRRIMNFTTQPVDNDMKLVGKESKLLEGTFVNKRGYPKPGSNDNGTLDGAQLIGGYSPAEEGDETGKHPDLVQDWGWSNKYKTNEAAQDNNPYAREGFPKGDKSNYHTIEGKNRYDDK